MDTDVLIVGAGPTGLMLADQLKRRGIRMRVIDRHAGPARETRALGVQARTLEIYQKLGIAERALELGKKGTGANLWARGRRMARVPLGDAGKGVTPFPFILVLGQDDNERIMGEKLKELGGAVEWDTELVGLTQDGKGANATLKRRDGGVENGRAVWVAGCDGAKSAVRTLNDIGFPGAPYEHVFFVADVEAKGRMVPDEVNVYLLRQGFHLLFPMRGQDHWRVVGILPEALRGKEVSFEELIPYLRNEAGADLDFRSCSWFSTYRIHHRSAERFQAGRCFLLGDAAHIHSPVGAQGMNTGLQDAYNLAWKLALVVAGRAGAQLLDSYEAERVPVAERLLRTTDRAFAVVVSDRWAAAQVRLRLLPGLLAVAPRRARARTHAFRTISQLGIHSRGSPLSQTLGPPPRGGPRAGDRFPWLRLVLEPGGAAEDLYARLDDTRFCLLLFGQAAPAGLSDEPDGLLAVHVVPDDPVNARELARARIVSPSAWLLRPDGHVGLAGARLDAADLARYLTERLALAPARPPGTTTPTSCATEA
jgi:2-polyprenyl-6-methoxyphenol hydroxylase-like FAD-dependent oxidoreductase